MKKMKFSILAASMFILAISCADAPDADKATTGDAKEVATAGGTTLTVDPTASKVEWIGTKVSGLHNGEVPIKSGTITTSGDTVTGGRFVLDLKNMTITGPAGSDKGSNDKLLGHLKSGDFFDVEKNPEATFEITSVKPFSGQVIDSTDSRQEAISKYKVENPTHTIAGNLTIKGTTKNIEFPARVTANGTSVDALAKFNIDRTQWNIVYPGKPDDLIRNEIHLGIALKANK
ncbi:MAG: YceI family protein [Chitinophagaceae bacterium]|nr:YceI family protein [Chitinophagaceae bacterium]